MIRASGAISQLQRFERQASQGTGFPASDDVMKPILLVLIAALALPACASYSDSADYGPAGYTYRGNTRVAYVAPPLLLAYIPVPYPANTAPYPGDRGGPEQANGATAAGQTF
jgi:hypothetical protein